MLRVWPVTLFRFRSFFASMAIGLFLFAPSALAATPPKPTTCDCYCATSAGANRYPDKDTKTTRDACASLCKSKGFSMVACAFTAAEAPDRSPYCYTEEQCKKQNGILDKKQTWDCVAGQKYCFADPAKAAKVALNVAIPNPTNPSSPLTLTGDIGEYVNAIFSFMINAGMIIAIVMVMIGGLQYVVLGPTTKDGIGKAKERMTNGVTGFVLLLCVYLIAQTVNPYLIRLKLPEFPMVKPIGFASDASSCEEYREKKDASGKVLYKLETDLTEVETCGKSSNVLAADGQPAVAAGTSCDYKGCPAGKGCLGSGTSAKCVECVALTKGNTLGLKASASACSQLSPKPSGVKDAAIIRCGYTEDTDMISGNVAGAGAVATGGTCAQLTINCAAITSCEDYDKQVEVKNNEKTQPLEDIQNTHLGINKGNFGLESICNENPCGLGFPPKSPVVSSPIGMCKYNTGSYNQKDDCIPNKTIELDGTVYNPGKY